MIALLLLAQINGAYALPVQGYPGSAHDLPARIDSLCGAAGASSGTLLNREGRLQQDVPNGPAGATALRDLGCIRAMLAVRGTTGRDGLLMGTGVSYKVGAARAFAEALLFVPTDSVAAAGLALLALEIKDIKDVPKAGNALAAAVAVGNTRAGPVVRAAAKVALDRGDEATARRMAEKALGGGHDSTSALLVLARLEARHADSVGSMRDFIAAGGSVRPGLSRDEFDWQLQWFLSPAEDTVWRRLADTARATWIRDRIVSRDIRDGRPVGARVVEHFARLEFVESHFRIQVPDRVRERLRSGMATSEQYLMGPKRMDQLLRMGMQSCNGAGVPADSIREYQRWQLEYDDRGVAWMRYGAPEKRLVSFGAPSVQSGVCAGAGSGGRISENEADLAREAWLYHVDGQAIILSFEGEAFDSSVEATRFVTRVLGDYFCDIDTKRCNASSLFRAGMLAGGKPGQFLSLSDLDAIMRDDRRLIAKVITTDDNSRRVEHAIGMVGALYRLWDPATGAPRGLTIYALKIGDLQQTASDDGGKGAVFDLTLRQWDPATNHSSDTTLTRRVRIPANAGGKEELTGALVVPSTPGVTAWSLFATQGEDRQGRTAQESVPPLDAGGLTISDIVLGEARQGLTAMIGGTKLVLAPTGAVDRKSSVNLYYQLRSAAAHADVETNVALFRTDGTPKEKATAALEIRFPVAIQAGVNEVERTVDVSKLPPGAYRLEVLVRDRASGTTTRRSTQLNIH